jgi:nucleotide-binding universal stress UspA family protein
MTLPLVAGVDGSEASLMVADWAADEAALHGLPLRLLYISRWARREDAEASDRLGPSSERALAERVVDSAAARAGRRHPQLKVTTDIVPDEGTNVLLRAGENAFALVTGARGRCGPKGMVLGSGAPAVAARAGCPVIVVRGDKAGLAGAHERILLCAGEPVAGAGAARFALREAELRGCTLDVVRAWHRPARERAAEQASALLDTLLRDAGEGHPGVRIRRATVEGPAHSILVDRSAAADLVVLGTRRGHGRLGLRLGRVSHALLRHAACPVAVVPYTM